MPLRLHALSRPAATLTALPCCRGDPMSQPLDTIIICAGTAGLAALREVRKRTERYLIVNEGPWGTTCARVGCMPSKALIEAANAFHRRLVRAKHPRPPHCRDWHGPHWGGDFASPCAAGLAGGRIHHGRYAGGPERPSAQRRTDSAAQAGNGAAHGGRSAVA